MAYTLGDPFRPLRLILRINGIIIGLLLGLCFLWLPGDLFVQSGLAAAGFFWSLRLLGAGQIALGCFLLIAAGQRYMDRVLLFTATLTHALWVFALFITYLQGELNLSSRPAQLLFFVIFLLCLCGAVLPLRYMRTQEAG